ncbi:MAG TPA: enoyl-CoA hydratase-related protein [Methylomirabilota bacterium]|nr:enoyl-CoA hydratase-related protein [Methylomirabilota bacterium]
MSFQTIQVAREESVAIITMDRPPANAINRTLLEELDQAMAELERDDTVRSVIVVGAGDRIFCGGADLGEGFGGGDVDQFVKFGNGVLNRIEQCSKPVIAALNGHATGGGCELAMACHLRLMKESARLGQTESNLGIIPGFGGTQRLPRLIGKTRAMEMLLLGTQIPAPEALALGLVNRLSKEGETLGDAKALARQLAERAPIATRFILQCVNRGLNATLEEGLEIERKHFVDVVSTEDALEGIQAFFQKRKAEFKGK